MRASLLLGEHRAASFWGVRMADARRRGLPGVDGLVAVAAIADRALFGIDKPKERLRRRYPPFCSRISTPPSRRGHQGVSGVSVDGWQCGMRPIRSALGCFRGDRDRVVPLSCPRFVVFGRLERVMEWFAPFLGEGATRLPGRAGPIESTLDVVSSTVLYPDVQYQDDHLTAI